MLEKLTWYRALGRKRAQFCSLLEPAQILRSYSSTILAEMSSISVRPENRLEGASNFNVWKARVLNILEEYDLDNFVIGTVEGPPLPMQEGQPSRRIRQGQSESYLIQSKIISCLL